MKKELILSIGNTVGFALVIAVNILANTLPINGMNTGEVSDLYPSLFTPAGYTFSIWSVIYLLLLGFVIYEWKNRHEEFYQQLSGWFILSCVLNVSWIIAWHFLLPLLSVFIMLIFLTVLIRIFLLVYQHKISSLREYVFVRLPFTFYLSWICVATIANIAAYFTTLDNYIPFISGYVWTIVMMTAAAALAIVVLWKYRAFAFPFVTIWALAGIGLKGLSMITPAAFILIGVVVMMLIWKVVQSGKQISS